MNSNLSNMLAGAIVSHALSQPSTQPGHPAASPRAPTAPSATPAPLTFVWDTPLRLNRPSGRPEPPPHPLSDPRSSRKSHLQLPCLRLRPALLPAPGPLAQSHHAHRTKRARPRSSHRSRHPPRLHRRPGPSPFRPARQCRLLQSANFERSRLVVSRAATLSAPANV